MNSFSEVEDIKAIDQTRHQNIDSNFIQHVFKPQNLPQHTEEAKHFREFLSLNQK